jgi:hypothetical protein
MPMGQARDLLKTARATLTKWPSLWLPPLLINAFQSLAGMPMASWVTQAVVALCVNLAGFLIQGGWLSMIDRALQGETPRIEDFKGGVNRHGASLIGGNLVYFISMGGLLALFAWGGDRLYRLEALQAWVLAFSKLDAAHQQAMLEIQHLPAAIQGWFMLFALWLGVASILSFMLIYWQPLVVLRQVSWWRGWFFSAKITLSRFKMTLGFVVRELIACAVCLLFASSGNPLVGLMGLIAFIFVLIYYKILYATVVRDVFPLPVTGIETPAALPLI